MPASSYPSGIRDRNNGTIKLYEDDIRIALVRGTSFNQSHSDESDFTGAGGVVVARTAALSGWSFSGGEIWHESTTFGVVASGAPCNGLIWYKHHASNPALRKFLWWEDNAFGLPVTPDGSTEITVDMSSIPYLVGISNS